MLILLESTNELLDIGQGILGIQKLIMPWFRWGIGSGKQRLHFRSGGGQGIKPGGARIRNHGPEIEIGGDLAQNVDVNRALAQGTSEGQSVEANVVDVARNTLTHLRNHLDGGYREDRVVLTSSSAETVFDVLADFVCRERLQGAQE